MGGCTAFGTGCTVKARLRTAGEAEAAEPSTHNGAAREGEGRRLQRGWEQEWWERGRDKREAGMGKRRISSGLRMEGRLRK